MTRWIIAAAILMMAACAPRVPVLNVASVTPSERAAASKVRVLPPGAVVADFDYVGPVEGNSCKHMMWEPPAAAADAIEQMRINAFRLGATAVMDFTCTPSGTDAYGTDCWNSVHCGGTAIRVK